MNGGSTRPSKQKASPMREPDNARRGISNPESLLSTTSRSGRRRRENAVPGAGAIGEIGEFETAYHHLVERSLQGVLIAEGYPPKILFANDALARMLGCSVKEFQNFQFDKLKRVIHPTDRKMFFRRYRDRLDGKKVPSHYETRIVREDGSTGWIELYASRMEFGNRRIVQATFIDITDHKLAEENLRQSEEKYRAIIEHIDDGYYEVDLAGNLTFYNDAMADVMGYGHDELAGLNKRHYMDDANAEKVYRIFNRVYRTGRSERACECEIIRKDGERRIIEASISLMKDAGGKPVGFRGIVGDVTEEKRIEQALRESERRYHNVYNTAPLAFVLWDSNCRITDWNRHAEMVFGWKREEVLGKKFFDILVPGHERQRVKEEADRIFQGRMAGRSVNENLTKSGDIITCEWNSTIFYGKNGAVEEVLSLALDVTERKNLEDELFQSRKMESIGRLAGGVAHDLNNMLTPILGYADMLLLDVPMDDSHLEGLIQIKDAADRARDLTRQLLAFSRKQVLEMKILNLGEVVCGFEQILRRTIREDIELEITIADGAGNIMTDASQVEQILLNLAVNAQEAMPDGGRLGIQVSNVVLDDAHMKKHPDARKGRHVMLSVSDTGCGMDRETLEHMYEPFYTTRKSGTGLGLSTVYGIVKQHNGSIWASSRPDRGTIFRIYFPRAEGEVAPKVMFSRGEVITTKGETILIVEDEEAVRKLASKILEKHGYRVLTAAGGDEALGIVREHRGRIDLLLTDVIMPKMDGKSLYRKVAELRGDIRVLYMSGYTHDVIANHGVVEEGINFIQKPFSFQTLTEKIREILDR